MTRFNVNSKYSSRELEFRAMTRKWIQKKHAQYVKSAEQLKTTKPIRHPRGAPPAEGHSVERLWSDALWCQDASTDPFVEFFELEDGTPEFDDFIDGGGCNTEQDWAMDIFNAEFKAVLPELAHVLEG